MPKEDRIGAKGLSNDARTSNVLRYQYGRLKYHALEALKLDPSPEEHDTLTLIMDGITELLGDRPLEGGEEAESLITKGKKAASKAKEEPD